MNIEQVFSRQGNVSREGMVIRKRIISAVIAMNGDCEKAKANLDFSFNYTIGTIKAYWSDYGKLSSSEKIKFQETPAADIAALVGKYVAIKKEQSRLIKY